MPKKNTFYQVTHKGASVGFFKSKENAEKYSEEFCQNIGGYSYPIKIIKKSFLDYMFEEDVNP